LLVYFHKYLGSRANLKERKPSFYLYGYYNGCPKHPCLTLRIKLKKPFSHDRIQRNCYIKKWRYCVDIIAKLPYVKVIRKITWNKQYAIEETHQLELFDDVICSHSEQFKFRDVLDISYRTMSEDTGFLYLHTNRGVYSFYIKTNPSQFIDTYKKQKKFFNQDRSW
jgi:hypothetical protein